MAKTYDIGKEGERVAFRYLIGKAYRILAQNWFFQHKELDLVATDGQWVVVVEVKTRVENSLQKPIEAVDRVKQRNICVAADAFVRQFRLNMPIRYDVLSVIFHPASHTFEVEHLENAFYPELNQSRRRRY